MNTDSKVQEAIRIDELSKNILEKQTYFAFSDANNFENLLDCDAAWELVDEVEDLGERIAHDHIIHMIS